MKILKLTNKEFNELYNVLWVIAGSDEDSQNIDNKYYDKEYNKIMNNLYKKFGIRR